MDSEYRNYINEVECENNMTELELKHWPNPPPVNDEIIRDTATELLSISKFFSCGLFENDAEFKACLGDMYCVSKELWELLYTTDGDNDNDS